MPEKPILFSGPFVKALLQGRKTQTRRLITRLKGTPSPIVQMQSSETKGYAWDVRDRRWQWHCLKQEEIRAKLPYQVGDSLWVREVWCPLQGDYTAISSTEKVSPNARIAYQADHRDSRGDAGPLSWRSPMHMPR